MAWSGFVMNSIIEGTGNLPAFILTVWIISLMCTSMENCLGHHTGYFEPFKFDVTETLKTGKNILAVRVESPFETPGLNGWHLRKRLIKGVLNHHDCRPGGGWDVTGQSYNTGGIWNRVYLEKYGEITIDQLLLNADMDTQPPTLHLQLKVTNRSGKRSGQAVVRCKPENFKGVSETATFPLEIPEGTSVHQIKMGVENVKPWKPWDRGFPHLYEVKVSLVDGKETCSKFSLFGFRTVRVESGFRWFINDQPYFPRGSNYLPSQWLAETIFPAAATAQEHPFGGGAGGDFFTRDVSLARASQPEHLARSCACAAV